MLLCSLSAKLLYRSSSLNFSGRSLCSIPSSLLQILSHVFICRGLDPIVFAALCGVASGVTGYILGGALFHATWKFLFKKKAVALEEVSN